MEEAITFIVFSLNSKRRMRFNGFIYLFCFLSLWLLATKSAKLLNS